MAVDFEALMGLITRRRSAYVNTFAGPAADKVLADLAVFCRATTSTFHADPRVHAVAEGRREVWLRIQNHLHLSDEQLLELITSKSSKD